MLTERQRIFNELAKRADRLNSVADVCLDEIARLRAIEAEVLQAQEPVNCTHCDGTGDVHSPDGEWRGECNCGAEKYAMLDRFLRNNLDDDDYAEYSAALDVVAAPQPPAPCPKCAKLEEENRKAQQEIAGDIVTIRKCDNLLKLSRAKVAYYEAQMCLPDGAFVAIPNGYSAQVAARSVSPERVADVITQRDELRAEVERLTTICADKDWYRIDALQAKVAEQAAEIERQTDFANNFAAQVRQQNETIASLRAEVERLTKESDHWKANHDNRVEAARVLMDRPDLPLERTRAYLKFVTAQATIAQQAERIAELTRAIDEQMVSSHLGVFNDGDDPRVAINKLLCWSQDSGGFFAKERIAELEEENIKRLETSCQQHAKIMDQAALIEKCEKALRSAVEWGAPMQDAPKSARPEWFDAAKSAIAAQKCGSN